MTNNSQLLYDIENAIEALEALQGHPSDSLDNVITRSDGYREYHMLLWVDICVLLDDLRKKRSQVRKTVYDEEMKSMEEWERISTQGQAPHQPVEQEA